MWFFIVNTRQNVYEIVVKHSKRNSDFLSNFSKVYTFRIWLVINFSCSIARCKWFSLMFYSSNIEHLRIAFIPWHLWQSWWFIVSFLWRIYSTLSSLLRRSNSSTPSYKNWRFRYVRGTSENDRSLFSRKYWLSANILSSQSLLTHFFLFLCTGNF